MNRLYNIFYNKSNTSAPIKVSFERVLRIIIDDDLTLTPHIKCTTRRCKKAYNRLTQFPDMRRDLAFKIFKPFIRSKIEYGSIILGHVIYRDKHCRFLVAAHKSVLTLIFGTMEYISHQ